ncbi:PepSY domain-containing protein [Cellulomonas sp. NPDC089187]|uniref:PepSY domain-containing protein n=1 Tax=Cellulomonas sp. NPDC089187 TaxID=3154970 RepID=UPI003433183A
MSTRRTVATLTAVAALGLLTACSGTDEPKPTATVTVTAQPEQPATQSPQATGDADTSAATSDDAVQAFIDAQTAFIDYKQSWTGGNLGADPEFQRLKQEFIQAKQAINRTDLWLGANSDVTGSGMAIPADEAVRLGQEVVRANATPVEVTLDEDDGRLTWEIEYDNGDDATIDADTGAVVEFDLND